MECTKHVVTDQRDITIRDLRDRVAELEAEREAVLDKAARVASIRAKSPTEAIEFVEAAMAQVVREKMFELARAEKFKARASDLEHEVSGCRTRILYLEKLNP